VLDKLADPLGVPDVRLATWDGLEVVGVEQPGFEIVLEQGVHRFPVDPGRLHAHDGDAERGQPVA
jgi:hypothetical protein